MTRQRLGAAGPAIQAAQVGHGTAPEIVAPPDLAGLGGEWAALWRRCPQATPFQAPEWLLPWARYHAPSRCGAVALRMDGRLVGLAPVFCWEGALLLAGTGPSDHGDALIEPGSHGQAALLLSALPAAAPEPFDRLDLQQLAPHSPLLSAALPAGWREERRAGHECHVAPLGGEHGLAALSGRRRENWRYALRRLQREGGRIGLAGPGETGEAMADLLRLHGLRWRARGEEGVLSDPLLRAFLLEAAPEFDRAGLLRLHQVRLGQERIAVLMVLAGREAHHYFIGGFDPAHGKLSPSAVLVGAAMAQAHEEGARWFDFLRGHEAYKADWGAEPRPMHRRILVPPAAGGSPPDLLTQAPCRG